MSSLEKKSLDSPDETRTPDKSKIDIVHLGDTELGRFTFQPGWKWSECIKPVVQTDSCQASHVGYVISGKLHVVHDDGSEAEVGPGDSYRIDPGHDGWVVGDEPFVSLEVKGVGDYAKS